MKFSYVLNQGLEITIDKLHLDWHPIALLVGTLHMTHLINVENIKIVSPSFPEEKNEKEKIHPPAQRKLLLSLKIEEGYLKNISIDRKTEAPPVLVKNLRLNQVKHRSLISRRYRR